MVNNGIGQSSEGFVFTPVQPGMYTGEKGRVPQPQGIGQPEGFIITTPAEAQQRVETTTTDQSLADDAVNRYREAHGGQNGDLSALVKATREAREAREVAAKKS